MEPPTSAGSSRRTRRRTCCSHSVTPAISNGLWQLHLNIIGIEATDARGVEVADRLIAMRSPQRRPRRLGPSCSLTTRPATRASACWLTNTTGELSNKGSFTGTITSPTQVGWFHAYIQVGPSGATACQARGSAFSIPALIGPASEQDPAPALRRAPVVPGPAVCLDTAVSRLPEIPASLRRMPRDYLAAVRRARRRLRRRDGRDARGVRPHRRGLRRPRRASATRRSCSTAPTSSRACTRSMVAAGAQVVETDTFQASRLKLEEWGLGEHTLEINVKAAEIARTRGRRGPLRRRLDRPDRPPPRLRRPDARPDPRSASSSTIFAEQAARPRAGRRRPADHRDRAGHPRGQGRDLRRPRGVQGGRPRRADPVLGQSLLPNGGKMLLGTDIDAVLTTLESLKVDVIGLNCSTGPEDMRDAIRFLGEFSSRADPLHPERRPAAAGPGRRDDLPGEARAARRGARRVRRALRRVDRRRLLRHDARRTSRRSPSAARG